MWRSHGRQGDSAANDWSRYDLEDMGLRALAGRRLGFWQRRAGFVVLAADIDEEAAVAAVWLARRPESPDSADHTLHFERKAGWHCLGGGSGRLAQELSLAGRPSASVTGPASLLRLVTSSASRIRADGQQAAEPGLASAEWVACAGFRVAAEARHLQAGERVIAVPSHGYAVVVWRSPPALTRPVIAALGEDGSRLSELGPHGSVDSLTWDSVQEALRE